MGICSLAEEIGKDRTPPPPKHVGDGEDLSFGQMQSHPAFRFQIGTQCNGNPTLATYKARSMPDGGADLKHYPSRVVKAEAPLLL